MQLQPFSVNDGEGIRTNIFIAGCPLRCRWCSNPEGFTRELKVGWHRRKCIGCGACAEVCPQGIGIDMDAACGRSEDASGREETGHDLCIACGACVRACPEGARAQLVSLMDADDIIREVHRHRLFYSYSGGGITFTGGEATSQPELLEYLSRELYDSGYSLDLESCGYFDFGSVRSSLERMDLIFMDLKLMDPEKHRKYTGVSNGLILENIAKLAELDAAKVIRIPVIGGVNDDEENIAASAAYVHRVLPEAKMELLPYHKYGQIKYEALGIPFGQEEFFRLDAAEMERLREIVRSQGVETVDYR